MSEKTEHLARHIGDGLYFMESDYYIGIAVNHHENTVAYLDKTDIDTAINFLKQVKIKLNH